jgi:hypothetical protein
MAREVPEIDRLIEEGLTLYGQGDLDGALARWEKALVIDPDNPQANSYVDYVRQNYELLTAESDTVSTAEGAPFGIADDEPEYQIEIQPGEIRPVNPTIGPPMFMDPLDEGWFIDEETRQRGHGVSIDRRPSQELTMELEADEPPDRPPPPDEAPTPRPKRPASVLTIEADEPPPLQRPMIPDDAPTPRAKRPSQVGMDFDDDTREYDKKRHTPEPIDMDSTGFTPIPSAGPDEFGPDGTPGFGHPNDFQTPPGFGTQTTGIKQRDLGFVQATAGGSGGTPPSKPPGPAGKPLSSTDLGLPDRPRTPAKASQPPATRKASHTIEPLPAHSLDELTLEPSDRPPPPDDAPTLQRGPVAPEELDDLDLISSLPSPRPKPRVAQIAIDTPLSGAQKVTTRDFPHQTRAPAVPAAKTKELSPSDLLPSVGSAQTQDFDVKTQERNRGLDRTQDIPNMQQAARLSAADNPVVSAPTRDLGLRAESIASGRGDGTRADVVLAFDPIDARATDIIEDVDETAPAKEAPEDKTRRRITTLFEKAAQWSADGDLERAVAAVDLALSEDPNSALAQKLIHRNRDTMMTVFQAYLGDLQRTPQLARPLHELANAPISPRAAFLLSRIDGHLSVDEILDVCGMPRLEAFRHLCQLFLRGILR